MLIFKRLRFYGPPRNAQLPKCSSNILCMVLLLHNRNSDLKANAFILCVLGRKCKKYNTSVEPKELVCQFNNHVLDILKYFRYFYYQNKENMYFRVERIVNH